MQQYLEIIADGETLSQSQAEQAMDRMMSGAVPSEQVAAFLMGLRSRGETVAELAGFTRVMREYAVSVDAGDPDAIDLCGTGGDAPDTFNISTTASFICAGAGATVAKHGNRSVSSNCGSADVLEALGVVIDLEKEGVERCLDEVGIAFIFAPNFHPAMRHVMPVRKSLGVRTFFNILGPLSNPAGVQRQVVGAFNTDTARLMADILETLGAQHVVTLHARDGLDEFSLSGPTAFFEHDARNPDASNRNGQVFEPDEVGLEPAPLDDITGGTLESNKKHLLSVLDGNGGPRRDIAVLNAAFGLYVTDRFDDIGAALDAAQESIDSGAAREKLDRLVEVSQQAAS